MKDAFDTYHPIVSFGYFCTVIICGMIFMEPVCLLISFCGALTYAVYLKGKKAVKFFLCFGLPLMTISVAVNFLFNHHGVTMLFYFRGNPVTLEALVYGIATAVMFSAVIMWFYCYNEIISSDKFIYIFGRILPMLSLIFSMVMRFIPRFTIQMKIITAAEKGMNQSGGETGMKDKFKTGLKAVSIMITWALENSIDTANSMKARGYGLSGRTSYSIFRFDLRDMLITLTLIVFILAVMAGTAAGYNTMEYYPRLLFQEANLFSILNYGAYFFLCFFPVGLNIKENLKWKHLQSKI